MASVTVDKTGLINVLKTNRGNHDEIYRASCSGFWIKAKDLVVKKQEQFSVALTRTQRDFDTIVSDFNTGIENRRLSQLPQSFAVGLLFDTSINLKYPENHTEDYDKTISMLEMSIADKVTLLANEFNAYVRNNWSWFNSFSKTNYDYVSVYSGFCATGYAGIFGTNTINASKALNSNLSNFLTTAEQ